MECATLEKSLEELHDIQDANWYLRSRVSEVKDGDRNMSYFHHKASQRKKHNYVAGLFDKTGVWHEKEENIKGIFEEYFRDIFASSNLSPTNIKEVLQYVSSLVSDASNHALLKPFTKKRFCCSSTNASLQIPRT